MKKKILIFALIGLLMFTFFGNSVMALANYGEFNYWYSDSSSIMFLNDSTVRYAFTSDPDFGMNQTDYINSGIYGISQWTNHLNNISSQFDTNYNLLFWGISRATADKHGLAPNVVAQTMLIKTLMGTGTYNTSTKNVYSISYGELYYIWDTNPSDGSVQTSNFGTLWKAIASHEVGHFIGYYGHNTDSSIPEIMYPDIFQISQWQINQPQTNDIRHMSSMYSVTY